MKRFQNVFVYLAVLALSGAVTVKSVEPGKTATMATVRSVKGSVTYSISGGPSGSLTPNTELPAGAIITTGPNSDVYISVNGLSSAVHVKANTTLAIPTMDKIGSGRSADTDTLLDLRVGDILGQVKKVSGNSLYEIKTPHGVAGIRGTDFAVSVVQDANNQFTVTFSSITGSVIISGLGPDGNMITRTLTDGQSFTFAPTSTTGPAPTLQSIQTMLQNQINDLIVVIPPYLIITPISNPNNPNNGGGNNGILPVFPGGPPPGQESSPGQQPSSGS